MHEQLQAQLSGLLPLLDGPGGVLCSYVEAHGFLGALRSAVTEAQQRAAEAQVRVLGLSPVGNYKQTSLPVLHSVCCIINTDLVHDLLP